MSDASSSEANGSPQSPPISRKMRPHHRGQSLVQGCPHRRGRGQSLIQGCPDKVELDASQIFHFAKRTIYSGDLNTGLVHYLNELKQLEPSILIPDWFFKSEKSSIGVFFTAPSSPLNLVLLPSTTQNQFHSQPTIFLASSCNNLKHNLTPLCSP
jgi:hypothetical protein